MMGRSSSVAMRRILSASAGSSRSSQVLRAGRVAFSFLVIMGPYLISLPPFSQDTKNESGGAVGQLVRCYICYI